MHDKFKFVMIAAVLLLFCSTISSASAAHYNVTNSSYSKYFNSSGYINNNVKSGDVLDLYGTIQNKNMYINRPLNITSSSKTGKIINGTITILFGGSGSNVTGLKINNTKDNLMGIVLLGSDNNTLKGNTIQSDGSGGHGIALGGSNYNNIIGNKMSEYGTATWWTHSPILLENSNHNNIKNNYVLSSVSNCIYLSDYGTDNYTTGLNYYNNIINNTCIGVDTVACYAIQMMGSHNLAQNNNITTSNQGAGLYHKGAYWGISSQSDNEGGNTIIGNTIEATNCGIHVISNCIISGNTITNYKDANTPSYSDATGINAGPNCTITNNTITMSNGYGVYLTGSNCTVTSNKITTAGTQETIYMYGPITGNIISKNTIKSKSTGVIMKEQSSDEKPTLTSITSNHITTTSTYAVNTSDGTKSTITNNYLVSNNNGKMGNSAVSHASTDTVKDNTPAAVTYTPAAGYYNKTITVTLKMNIPSGTIYYTINGSTPTSKSTKYTTPLNITKTTTLKFMTIDSKGVNSPVISKTYTIDKIKPVIKSTDPKNGAVNVPLSKTIKVTFSENIKKGSKFWIELKNSAGKAITFYTPTISGKVLTINPKSNLAESKYTLILHTGAVTDLAGNPMAGKSISFTAGTPPTIKTTDPKNGATKISRNKTMKLNFSEAIKAASGSKYWIELKTNNGKSVKITKSIKNSTLTITHSKLAANTKYTLTIHTGSVTDKAGNPVKAKTTSFTTGRT